MGKKKFGSSEGETREHKKSKGSGGRPMSDGFPSFLAKAVLALYVSFLRSKYPERWRPNQVNSKLFSDPGKRKPLDGIGLLLGRLSLPILTPGEILSAGILRTEGMRDSEGAARFAGGLQILFNPYVRLLAAPADLSEIHWLMRQCGLAYELGFFRYTRDGGIRTHMGHKADIETISARIRAVRSTPSAWNSDFLNLMGLSFGLALEARAILNPTGLRDWKRWFAEGNLRFEDWPVGGLPERQCLDRWLAFVLDQCIVEGGEPEYDATQYLLKHVVATLPTGKPSERMLPMSYWEQTWTFLALRNGRSPTRAEMLRARRLHRFPLVGDDIAVRWARVDDSVR